MPRTNRCSAAFAPIGEEIVFGAWIEIYRAAVDTALRMKTYCCVKPTDKSLFVKSDG
jgi:hypothetical protein